MVICQLRTKAEVAAFRQFDPTFSGKQLSAIGCAERVAARIRAELAQWGVQREKAVREGRTPPRKPCHIAILSTSTAKLGPAWTPVYLLRALRDSVDMGEDVGDGSAGTGATGHEGHEGRAAGQGRREKVKLLRDPATGKPYVVPCCPRCFALLKDEARAERVERERAKRKSGGRHTSGNRDTRDMRERSGMEDGAGDDGGDDEVLDAYLSEAELLDTSGCRRAKRSCASCGEALWQVIPDSVEWQATPPPLPSLRTGRLPVRPLPLPSLEHHPPCLTSTLERRYPLADYLRKRHRGLFRRVICDEAHQFKGAGTAQGFSAASLVDACDPGGTALFLTGTLFSGYASDLYPMLWRLLPELRQAFGYGDLKRWVDLYGVRQKIVKVREPRPGHREDGAVSKRREDKPLVKELPGISPLVLRHLLDSCLFLELADVAPGLPPYSEEVVVVPLGETLGPVYAAFERESTAALKEMLAHEDHSGLAAWFQGLMIQPNRPWLGFTSVSLHGDVLGQAEPLPEDIVYPKERALLDLVRRERAQGRRVLVYVEHTQAYDLLPRLKGLLEADDASWREQWAEWAQHTQQQEQEQRDADGGEAGHGVATGVDMHHMPQPPSQRVRVALLRSATVASGEREEWLRRTVEHGCDVLICHSGLVEVGLDLLDFPTIVCDEAIFSTCRARQATRRSYRPGQTQPVKVVQLVYDKTMEARGLHLIASKIKSSLMVEGKLPGEGLAAFGQSADDQGNLLLELARSVLADEEGGARDVAGSLEATFRDLAAVEQEQDGYIGEVELPTVVVEEDLESQAAAEVEARTERDSVEIRAPADPNPCDGARSAAGASAGADISTSRPTPTAKPLTIEDPWARWRELQRQAQLARGRVHPSSRPRHNRTTAVPSAHEGQDGSLWATPTGPLSPAAGRSSPVGAGSTDDDQPGGAVQATLWADE